MTVWLASYPRSGNRFSRTILSSLFQAECHSATSLRKKLLDQGGGDSKSVDSNDSHIIYVKTHSLPDEVQANPALYVVRDGRDSYVSYAHFVIAHYPEQHQGMDYGDVLKMLVQSNEHYAGWSAHVEQWIDRPAQTAVLRYEDMIHDPADALTKACDAIRITLPKPSGVIPPFEELRALKPLKVRKGRIGSWRDDMPSEIEEIFWTLHGATMDRLGYAR